VPGDDPRHIDWRSITREKNIVKQYRVETFVCISRSISCFMRRRRRERKSPIRRAGRTPWVIVYRKRQVSLLPSTTASGAIPPSNSLPDGAMLETGADERRRKTGSITVGEIVSSIGRAIVHGLCDFFGNRPADRSCTAAYADMKSFVSSAAPRRADFELEGMSIRWA